MPGLFNFSPTNQGMSPVSGLSETMQTQEEDPYATLQRIMEMFAPQFQSPSEDWQKQNKRDSMFAAGAAMLGGSDPLQGLGSAGQAYIQTKKGLEQQQQQMLDTRSQADALSKYRAGSLSGIGDKPQVMRTRAGLMRVYSDGRTEMMPGTESAALSDPDRLLTPEQMAQRRELSGRDDPFRPRTEPEWAEFSREQEIRGEYFASPQRPEGPPSPTEEKVIFENYWKREFGNDPEAIKAVQGEFRGLPPERMLETMAMERVTEVFMSLVGRQPTISEALSYMRTGLLPSSALGERQELE